MWARHFELALAVWLALSPFVFGAGDASGGTLPMDLACALLIACLALATYWRRARYAHLAELAVALWLVGHGWWATRQGHPAPTDQNHIVVGLLLSMFALVPSRSEVPPGAWRALLEDRAPGGDGRIPVRDSNDDRGDARAPGERTSTPL